MKGTEVNSRLRYIEIVEITREDIYVTAKEADNEIENGGRNLPRPSSEYPSYLRFIRYGHGREKSCSSFSLSVPSRGASMALFYLSRPTGERASFELPSLTPGSPDITSTSLDRIL